MPTKDPFSPKSNLTRDLLVAVEKTGEMAYANEAFLDRFFGPGREAAGRSFLSLLHADDHSHFEAARERLAKGVASRSFEARCLTVGGWRWFRWELNLNSGANGDGELLELRGRDSTREKFREEQLFKLSQAVEQSPVAIAMTDTDGYVQYANPKYMDAVGYTLEEILDRRTRILDTARLSLSERKALWKTLAEGGTWSREVIDRGADGKDHWLSVRIAPISEGSEKANHLLVILDDITDRKELERQIREAQKMDNLGTLAGGIAHDFNNLLCVMKGYCNMAQKTVGTEEPVNSHLKHIQSAVDRAVALVQQILTFARSSESNLRPVYLNRVVKDLLEIASETFPRTIEFHLQMDNALPWIEGDTNQLHQALLNAAVNARDAMDGKGTLVIRTFQAKPEELPPHALRPSASRYAAVSISDSGSGMDEATLRRIFEPFFTTKDIGKGTGLGLAVTYGIVQGHGGYVDVRSTKGEGSIFTFYFPGTDRAERVRSEPEEPPEAMKGSGETVLVVEDEASQLGLLRSQLEAHNYKVLVARDGVAGLEAFQEHIGEIDLLVSDVGLPRMGGWEMFLRMREKRPELRGLFLSGFLSRSIFLEVEKSPGVDFLQKPYNMHAVLSNVHALLADGN